MTRSYLVAVECPRCDNEIEVEASVSGGYSPATRESPAEYPEVEWSLPTACACDIDTDSTAVNGSYSPDEIRRLDKAVEEAACVADDSALEDYYAGPDGPEDMD